MTSRPSNSISYSTWELRDGTLVELSTVRLPMVSTTPMVRAILGAWGFETMLFANGAVISGVQIRYDTLEEAQQAHMVLAAMADGILADQPGLEAHEIEPIVAALGAF